MLKEERQNRILEMLQENGKVVASELTEQFFVSEDTIRRDLRELTLQGRVQRVHGGALPHSPAAVGYTQRLKMATQTKLVMARGSLRFIRDGQTIFLDGGTTTLQVARLLPTNLRATIVTTSPAIAVELSRLANADVLLIGGRLNKEMQVITGAVAVDAIRGIHADLCLLGICSLDEIAGITTSDYEEARTKSAMIRSSDRVLALAGAEKLSTISPFWVGAITDLSVLITEDTIPTDLLAPYEQLGIEVVRC